MQFTIQMTVKDDQGEITTEDIIELDKSADNISHIGLSLQESKSLLKELQRWIVCHQAAQYTQAHRACPQCTKPRRVKGYHTVQYRTLFGIVPIPSLRVYRCRCEDSITKTTSLFICTENCPRICTEYCPTLRA